MAAPHLRDHQPGDLDALYEICLRTGDAGEDRRPLVADPRLLGDIYAAPYAALEPESAFVVDDGGGRLDQVRSCAAYREPGVGTAESPPHRRSCHNVREGAGTAGRGRKDAPWHTATSS
jgi:hypothetical protein